jgi:hypothetical protein
VDLGLAVFIVHSWLGPNYTIGGNVQVVAPVITLWGEHLMTPFPVPIIHYDDRTDRAHTDVP